MPSELVARDAIVTLLEYIGEDPTREGLVETPARVLRAWLEMTAGYAQDPAAILATDFEEPTGCLVVERDLAFSTMCEHHLLPFSGTATIAYLPRERVVGLSKLARLVECFALRLQIQERLTRQIAEALMVHLKPRGVGVTLKAEHACLGSRGVRQRGATTETTVLLGDLAANPSALLPQAWTLP